MASLSELSYHNSDFAMQKYLLLQSQHEELRQHLYGLCPTYAASATAVTSPSVSPTRSQTSFNGSPPPAMFHQPQYSALSPRQHRRSSLPPQHRSAHRYSQLEPVLDEELVEEMAVGEQKLSDVNEGIKRALTELLNCDTVRNDRATRMWVQARLMETEKELRVGRRRRSNGSTE